MEKYTIVLPYEGDDEKNELQKAVSQIEETGITFTDTRNLDGTLLCEITGNIDHLIQLFSTAITIAEFLNKRTSIFKGEKMIKQNVLVKNIIAYFNNLK